MAFSPTLHFILEYQGKCKVGENAIFGLSREEMVRNTYFHIKYSLSHLWFHFVEFSRSSSRRMLCSNGVDTTHVVTVCCVYWIIIC